MFLSTSAVDFLDHVENFFGFGFGVKFRGDIVPVVLFEFGQGVDGFFGNFVESCSVFFAMFCFFPEIFSFFGQVICFFTPPRFRFGSGAFGDVVFRCAKDGLVESGAKFVGWEVSVDVRQKFFCFFSEFGPVCFFIRPFRGASSWIGFFGFETYEYG